MKWQAVIVILAIGISISMPPSFPAPGDHCNHAIIGNLDVCHQAAPALYANGSMPCVHQCPCDHLLLVQDEIAEVANQRIKPLLIAFQDEHPPES